MKKQTPILTVLLTISIFVGPCLGGGAATRISLSGTVPLDANVNNPNYSYADLLLSDPGGATLAHLHIWSDSFYDPSDPFADTCDVAYLGNSAGNVTLACGQTYDAYVSGYACSASRPVTLGFGSLPAGHMLEIR